MIRHPSLLELHKRAKLEEPMACDEYLTAIAALAQCAYEDQLDSSFVIPAHAVLVRRIALSYLISGRP